LKTLALCAIIRIAVALNRCHKNAVKAVHLIRDSGKCALVRNISHKLLYQYCYYVFRDNSDDGGSLYIKLGILSMCVCMCLGRDPIVGVSNPGAS
jgi:hypothetical protein